VFNIAQSPFYTFRNLPNLHYEQSAKKENVMELLVNGRKHNVETSEGESLLTVLRDRLDLTGSKYGCGEGACGACTVLIDGTAARSCILPAERAAGKEITTIEGLSANGSLHPVQRAFLKVDVFQCSYCAPGMVMSAVSLLKKHPRPSRQEIVQGMQGNICRCGTYPRIVKAIQEASNT
jgi:aerobic-type carbon monoxide dehydrogenase small subunit (CoxS/CutS family)